MTSDLRRPVGATIEPLLHIGYHKTATSWLQHWIFVPDSPTFRVLSTPEHRPELAQSFFYDATERPLAPFEGNEGVTDRLLKEALAATDRGDTRIPVVSHEDLTGDPHAGARDARRISERLKRAFPRGKVLIGIREQSSFLMSSYFQYLWMGGTLGLRGYLTSGQRGKRPYFSPDALDYLPLVSYYHELFGRDNVLVLPYETFMGNFDSYFSRLSEFVGADIEIPPASRDSRIGARRDRVPLYYLRPANRLRWSTSVNDFSPLASPLVSRSYRRASLSLAWRIPDGVERRLIRGLRAEIQSWVGQRYAASNAQLADLIETNLGELGYPTTTSANRHGNVRHGP